MTTPSRWALPSEGIRFLIPSYIVNLFTQSPLCRDLYPLSFGFYPKATGHRIRRDEHDNPLLIYCTGGRAKLWVEGRPHQVRQGHLVLLPRDVIHEYEADAHEPWTIFWVHFDGLQSEAFIDNFGYSFENPTFPLGILPPVVADFEALLAVRRSGFSARAYVHAANHLRRLLTYIAVQIPKVRLGGEHALDIESIHGYMLHHLHAQIELDTLADQFGLSKYHFARRYKEITGRAPIQHFIQLKMEHACYLLDLSEMEINRVARELGYDDPYYFSRLFKKVIGVSPQAYRQARGRLPDLR